MTADWHTRDEARTAVFEHLETWYNRTRRHSTLGYLSPAAYEEQVADGSVVSLTYASTSRVPRRQLPALDFTHTISRQHAMSNGSFSGEPRTLWLTEPGDDRHMRVLELFTYTDPASRIWDAPVDSIVDGASIPRPLWTLVGSPYTGDYRRASIVHDVACDRAGSDRNARRAADRMFYYACRAGGCSIEQSTILYLGVRVGAMWPLVPQWSPAISDAKSGARLTRSAAEDRMETDFRQAGQMVFEPGPVDNADEIERRTDRALSAITGLDAQKL